MLQALLVTFREGLEASFVIGVIVACLRAVGRDDLLRAVRAGVAVSLVACAGIAALWFEIPHQPLYEAVAAFASAAAVTVLLVQMRRARVTLRRDIERRITHATTSRHAALGVGALTALLITREGFEAVLFLGVQALYVGAPAMFLGGALGLLGAVALAWSFARWGARLELRALMRVTTIYLLLFLAQLVLYGVHELAESGSVPSMLRLHAATERFGPEGDIGAWFSYALVAAPLLYLLAARRPPRVAPPGGGPTVVAT